MADDKKPPKLGAKKSEVGTSTASQSAKAGTKNVPPKKAPSKLPPRKQAPKLNQSKSQKPGEGTTDKNHKAIATSAQGSSPAPKLGVKKPTGQPEASKPAMSKNEPDRKRPKIAPKKSNTSTAKSQPSDGKQTVHKPPMAPRKPSTKPEKSSQRPKLAPQRNSNQVPKDAAAQPKATNGRPSLAPRKSSVHPGNKGGIGTAKQSQSEPRGDTPAHRLNEENRNLKDILSESQCADLTILIANVTERMRQSIEKAFNAKAGLELLNQAKEGEDSFANIDYDPATVDVGAYDKERKVQAEQEKELSKPQVQQLRTASLDWFDDWRQVVIQRVGEVVNSKRTAEKQKDDIKTSGGKDSSVEPQQRSQKISATGTTGEYAPPRLEDLFPRVRTPLTKLPIAQRVLVLHSILLLLLSLEHYNAASRVLLLYLASSLKVGLSSLRQDEEQTAQGLLEAAKQMTAEQEAGKKKQENAESRKWKIRLASAAGAAIIGYTGGMAAPMVAAGVGSVMGELGLGSTAAAGYLGTVAGNTAIVGSLFGAYGGRMTGQIMSNISADVEDFAFLPVHGERKDVGETLDAANDKRRLRVVVAVSGWLLEKEEVVSPWRVLKPSAEIFALRFELEALMNLGQSFDTMLSSAAYGYAQSALAKRTVFSELMSAMWPIALVKVARVVDNPFSLAKTRADKAGEVLAEAIMNRAQGERPVTLIGYSLGSRVIWSCLTTLAKKRGFGFVESAVMMGSPIPSDVNSWREMRSAVTGRLINVYSENDYLLAFLYRSASLQYGVAGLMPVCGLSGIENVDVSEMVSGHLRYRYLVGSILDKIRFEDVDKDEVAKESKAYEALVEEEKKNTYEKQVRSGAGNLYDEYGQRLGLPKEGKKYVSGKDQDVSDDQANKQASKMEKQVQDKTQKGLMQWAVEQLYITPASAPSKDETKTAGSDSKEPTEKAGKDAQSTSNAASKSMYERAMEATYLRRSGGPEGKAAARDKASKAGDATAASNNDSYLSSAANYIPSGYLPSFGGSSKSPQEKTPKKLGEQPKRPSTLRKTQSKSRGSVPQLNRNASAQKPEKILGKEPATNSQPVGSQPAKKTGSSSTKAQASSTAGAKPNEKSDDAPKATQRFSERFSESHKKAASDAAENPWDTLDAGKRGLDTAKKGWSAMKEGKQDVDDFTKTAKDVKETAEGYGSYIPSFGGGRSKETPAEPSKETPQDPKESRSTSKDPSNGKPDVNNADSKEDLSTEKSQESHGYTSYIPSFGFGGSSGEKPADDSKKEETSSDRKEEGVASQETGNTQNTGDGKDNQEPDTKETAEDTKTKNDGNSKDQPEPQDQPQAKDNPPKKRYPWEVAMDQGQESEAKSAETPAKQQSSSYNPASYMPSLGWGGSSEKKPKHDDDQNPLKSPRGGLMSDSDIYPEDSISSPEKTRRRPRSKQSKWKKDAIPESVVGDETPKESKDDGQDDGDGKKQSDNPSNENEQEQPEKKYPWEVAMEEGRDIQAEQEAKRSGLSSYMPSFGGGDGGWSGS